MIFGVFWVCAGARWGGAGASWSWSWGAGAVLNTKAAYRPGFRVLGTERAHVPMVSPPKLPQCAI